MSASWATSDIPFPGLVGVHLQAAAMAYNDVLDAELPDGPDPCPLVEGYVGLHGDHAAAGGDIVYDGVLF
jgi:hypothetical protein